LKKISNRQFKKTQKKGTNLNPLKRSSEHQFQKLRNLKIAYTQRIIYTTKGTEIARSKEIKLKNQRRKRRIFHQIKLQRGILKDRKKDRTAIQNLFSNLILKSLRYWMTISTTFAKRHIILRS
jgi:hypothetical protein